MVGEQIRRVRDRLKVLQRELHIRTGIDIAVLSRIEMGHSSPKIDTLIRIADATVVELEELVRLPAPD